MSLPVKRKAFAYIVRDRRLVVLIHPGHPEAGIQVPAGTMRDGESPEEAVIREATEETGLSGLEPVRLLGVARRDMSDFGRDEIHERHFFQLSCDGPVPESWRSYEHDPADGGPPIAFDFRWAPLDNLPPLVAGHDRFVPVLLRLLEADERS
ncbi:MAG: NUDIX domain-containing protein [Thermomicrobiales bacterium]|nr:NUDIX domain-containing protein [Thermomicrobiales bacterium]